MQSQIKDTPWLSDRRKHSPSSSLLLLLFTSACFLPALAAPGDVSPDFVHYANNTVFSTAIQPNGKIIIAGGFNTVEWTQRNGLARLNPNGALDADFNASLLGNSLPGFSFSSTLSGLVYGTMVQPDGKIVIAGAFHNVGGIPKTTSRDSIRMAVSILTSIQM
jgi:hypothetical protein